jgi:hypothetical protein
MTKLKWAKSVSGLHYATAPNGEVWFVDKVTHWPIDHRKPKCPTWSAGTLRHSQWATKQVPEYPGLSPVHHGCVGGTLQTIHEAKRSVQREVDWRDKKSQTTAGRRELRIRAMGLW